MSERTRSSAGSWFGERSWWVAVAMLAIASATSATTFVGLGGNDYGPLLTLAREASAEGRIMASWGSNPWGGTEGFIAIPPEPLAALLVTLGLTWLAGRKVRA